MSSAVRESTRTPARALRAPVPPVPDPLAKPRYALGGVLRYPDSPGTLLAASVSIGICVATVIGAVSVPLLGGDVWAAAASFLPALCGGAVFGALLYLNMTHQPEECLEKCLPTSRDPGNAGLSVRPASDATTG